MKNKNNYYAKGNKIKRFLTFPLLYFAWFSPHKSLRVFFHRLRGVQIGKNVEIGYFCLIGHVHPQMITIEDNAVITAKVTILEHDNALYYTKRGNVKYGKVIIGKGAFVGEGSIIMPGVKIGECAIVGALTFVNKNVPANETVVGNPARLLKK
ncbi:MAG TPA: acyltransferase [Smithellaceae bacterium]|nr:acyltransferase [Smithellaceae bacterium]